jgi:hypothetical protein
METFRVIDQFSERTPAKGHIKRARGWSRTPGAGTQSGRCAEVIVTLCVTEFWHYTHRDSLIPVKKIQKTTPKKQHDINVWDL